MPTASRVLVPSLLLAAVGLAASHAHSAAAAKSIRGKLTKPGYTVIAVGANGQTSSARARPNFKMRPPDRTVSLHLRRRDGVYAGPIVIAKQRKGRRVVTGVRAGARLGSISVRAHRGYARAQRVPKRWRNPKLWARASRGVPRGNGANFGRVRAKPKGRVVPRDPDLDGIPNRLDIDNDGDLALDPVDRRPRRHGSRSANPAGAQPAQSENSKFHIAVVFAPPFEAAVNANARTLTDADIDAALSNFGYLILGLLRPEPELDCGGQPDPGNAAGWIGGLRYCTRGGSGRVFGGDHQDEPFPGPAGGAFDPDGDGYGSPFDNGGPPPGFFFLDHRAKTSEIGTGDVLIQRSTSGEASVLLPFVFATAPALVSYDDGAGNSAEVEYPAPVGQPAPGSPGNPFPVRARPNGDVMVRLTMWRPQRRPIGSEAGDWIDIGGLAYTAKTHFSIDPSCPQNAFTENDTNLAPAPFDLPTGPAGLLDLAPDQPARPANTYSFTLNLTRCRAAHGRTFEAGEAVTVSFSGATVETGPQDGTRGQTDIALSFRRDS